MLSSFSALSRHRIASLAFAGLVSLGLAGCSSMGSMFSKDETQAFTDEPADKLYNEGLYELNRQSYTAASAKFEEVDKQHPYTEWARKAQLMNTYAKYSAGEYTDSATNARRYLQLHPGSDDAAYAQFLLAMSYYNQIPDVTRDQARTQSALEALEEVSRKYPDSEYASAARQRIQLARDQLAGKEMEVGRYYLKQRNFVGAVNRFRVVIEQYQTTRHVEEALARVAEAYVSLGVVSEAQTAAALLGHNFPQSQWYKDTYALMTSKGLEPREDTGSWMSRAFKRVGLG
jgi:outer membrane protein assembly factor BamD